MPFAYSSQMQLILVALSVIGAYVSCYYSVNMVLLLNGEMTSRRRMAIFVLVYPLIFEATILLASVTGLMHTLPYEAQVIFTVTNPIVMLLFVVMMVKILDTSMARSIKTAVEIYLFTNITRMLARLIEHLFFQQEGPQFNYLYNAYPVLINIALTAILFYVVRHFLRKKNIVVIAHENTPNKPIRRQLTSVFVSFCLIYFACAIVPAFAPNFGALGYINVCVILVLSFLVYVLKRAYTSQNDSIHNKEVHIGTLARAVDESHALRHDFNNILQTYSGYIELGDLDALRKYHSAHVTKVHNVDEQIALSQRMLECPELMALLISKLDYAYSLKVLLDIVLPESVAIQFIPVFDLCRCLSCLLDNAIEAASESPGRRASFFFDRKPNGSQLFIIMNGTAARVHIDDCLTPGYTTKHGHRGIGLPSIRKIADKYVNCSLRFAWHQNEYNAYLEVQPD